MPARISENHPIRQIFGALVERTFGFTLGMREPEMTRYLVNLLVDFIHMDHIYRIRSMAGRRLEEVAEMLMEADVRLEAMSFSREREVHRHIGDYTLFWTGVYPEMLRYLRAATRRDHLIDYVRQGKRSYHIVSTFDLGEWRRDAPLFRRLSEEFETCMYGLNLVRAQWERMKDQDNPFLIE